MKDIRILVEGSRGKSGLVKSLVDLIHSRGEDAIGKVTGKETVIFREGNKINIPRTRKSFLIDQENKKILKKYENVKYKIFENQALSGYTMKLVHNLIKPEIILIPNIRFEHQDRLGESMEEISLSFALNFKGAKKVITSENKEIVLNIFRKYCKKFGVKLIVVNSLKEKVPSISSISLINKTLEELGMEGLSKQEIGFLKDKVKKAMKISYSEKQEIYYFNGAKVNDIESTTNVFNYLKEENPERKFVFVCYLRKDRPERTESFLPFFDEVYKDDSVKRIYFTGSGLRHIKNNSKVVKNGKLIQKEVIEFCRGNNFVLFMAVNGVNDFMQELERVLGG